VNILLGKETDIRNVGYNLNQSKVAIRFRGFFGKDFLKAPKPSLILAWNRAPILSYCTGRRRMGFCRNHSSHIALYVGLLNQIIFLA